MSYFVNTYTLKFKVGDIVKRWHQQEYVEGTIRHIEHDIFYIQLNDLAGGSVTAKSSELELILKPNL